MDVFFPRARLLRVRISPLIRGSGIGTVGVVHIRFFASRASSRSGRGFYLAIVRDGSLIARSFLRPFGIDPVFIRSGLFASRVFLRSGRGIIFVPSPFLSFGLSGG